MNQLLTTLKLRNEALFYFGLFCLIGSILCIILMFTSQTKVLGINAWIKPFKFFLSSVIFVWSMAWFMYYLNLPQKVNYFSWMTILVLGFETIYITWQAYRGQLSHFNISTPFTGAMFALMGIAISIMTIWTAYIGYLFFTKDFPDLPMSYVWGIRIGILLFVIFAFQGGLMASWLQHTVGAPDGGPGLPLTNWSTGFGDLRIAHFLGMHALQILPLLGYFLIKDVKSIIITSILYFVITSAIFIQALMGRPLIKY